jgi:site-specific DNA-methyltransferase (adenine-specific)
MIDLRLGDCLATLRAMPDASVDSVVTDPPYGLGKEPKARRHRLTPGLTVAGYQHRPYTR